jgi:hypothetical protein
VNKSDIDIRLEQEAEHAESLRVDFDKKINAASKKISKFWNMCLAMKKLALLKLEARAVEERKQQWIANMEPKIQDKQASEDPNTKVVLQSSSFGRKELSLPK